MDTLCLFSDIFLRMAIPFLLEAAAVLAAFVHWHASSAQSHRLSMLMGFTLLPPIRNFKLFGYILCFVAKIKTAAQGDGFIRHGLRRLSGVFC